MSNKKIIRHPKGAFVFDQVVAVDIIPTLHIRDNAFTVTLKNGQTVQMRECDTGYTARSFIKEWEDTINEPE